MDVSNYVSKREWECGAYLALFACRWPAGLELFCCLNDGPLGAPYGLAGRFWGGRFGAAYWTGRSGAPYGLMGRPEAKGLAGRSL